MPADRTVFLTVDELPALLQEASKKDLAYSDFLEDVLSREIAATNFSSMKRPAFRSTGSSIQ